MYGSKYIQYNIYFGNYCLIYRDHLQDDKKTNMSLRIRILIQEAVHIQIENRDSERNSSIVKIHIWNIEMGI